MPRRDFNFTVKLLRKFFYKPHVKTILKHTYENGIWRFENWLQIELSFFISAEKEIGNWGREEKYLFDRRKKMKRESRYVDFVVRKKNAQKGYYIFWELKCRKMATSCIRAMFKDLLKQQALKAGDRRSYYLIGIHCIEGLNPAQNIQSYVYDKFEEHGLEINKNEILTEKIKGTKYGFTVF